MRRYSRSGFSSILGVLIVVFLVIAAGIIAYYSQYGTGFFSSASSRSGEQIKIEGDFPDKVNKCSYFLSTGRINAKCVEIKDNVDKKIYTVVMFSQIKAHEYLGKKVRVTGRFDQDKRNDSSGTAKIVAIKIEILGDGGGGGGQNRADLKMKVLPTLSSEMGKVNLAVSWNEALLNDSHLIDFRLNIRPLTKDWAPGGNWLISNDSVGKVTSKEFANFAPSFPYDDYVPGLRYSHFEIRLMAIFDNGPIKYEDVQLGLFEDRFESSLSFSRFWGVDGDPKSFDEVKIVNGVLSAKIKEGQKNYDQAGIYMGDYSGKMFAARVAVLGVDFPEGLKESMAGLLGGDYATDKKSYSVRITNEFGGNKIRQCLGPGQISCGNAVAVSGFPVVLDIISDGKFVRSYYEEQLLDLDTGGTKFGLGNGLMVSVGSEKPHYPSVSASFDNFRQVWVE